VNCGFVIQAFKPQPPLDDYKYLKGVVVCNKQVQGGYFQNRKQLLKYIAIQFKQRDAETAASFLLVSI